jgi:hypothetical protein
VSSSLRIGLATLLLALVLVWPPIQHGLARTYDLDAWAFFGWAMYAVPNLRVNVRAARLEAPAASLRAPAASLRAPAADASPDWNAISVGSYDALRAFAERRGRWGALLPPDTLARDLFRAQPDLPGILIRVRRWQISRETSRLVPSDTDYVYAPPGERVSTPD